MTLKSITLHRAVLNNANEYIDAGGEDLFVGDKPNQISEDRAREFLRAHGGVGHYDKAAAKPAKKPAAKKARAKPAATKSPVEPAPVPAPVDVQPVLPDSAGVTEQS